MEEDIQKAIEQLSKDLFGIDQKAILTRPEEQFGDYSSNIALQLAKQLGKPPREVAEELTAKLRDILKDQLSDVSVAGPGFINIKLSDRALIEALGKKPIKSLEGKVVVAEYSDPNPFKPLHAGHLYTTLVGDAVARLLEAGGAQTTRINYGGDVGLHVGKSMWAIIKYFGGEHPEKLDEINASQRAGWLGERYIEGNEAYETDEASKQDISLVNKRVYELHEANDHESPFAKIYWICRDWSYQFFSQLYDELEVHKFDRIIPESEVTPLGMKTVIEQQKNGVYEESDGAVVFKGEKYGLHTRVFINSQGLPTYETKDVGLMLTKWRDYHYDLSYYITGNEQAEYMAVMFKSVEQFEPEAAIRARSFTNGMVRLEGGIKMSSRKGNTVGALDILDAARQASLELIGQNNSVTVLGAVKYAFLKNRIGSDLIYEPKNSVSLEGNSGPYLQYSHARARSILSKAGAGAFLESEDTLEDGERPLLLKITEYPEVVDRAVNELMPHHICTYLYELAQTFNRFYENNRVIGEDRQRIRLALVNSYADTLKRGLSLLGIASPEKM